MALWRPTTGPCRASPTHSSFGRDASKRPKTAPLASERLVMPTRRKCRCMVRSLGAQPWAVAIIWQIWAAVRSGASRRSASAKAKTSAGTLGDSALGLGFSASKPPARQARIHSSRVERPTLTSSPSGPVWPVPASARTSRPRSALLSAGSAGSRTSA